MKNKNEVTEKEKDYSIDSTSGVEITCENIEKDEKKGIVVKCPGCGHKKELTDLAAWAFIILRTTRCSKCGATITLDDVVRVKSKIKNKE